MAEVTFDIIDEPMAAGLDAEVTQRWLDELLGLDQKHPLVASEVARARKLLEQAQLLQARLTTP